MGQNLFELTGSSSKSIAKLGFVIIFALLVISTTNAQLPDYIERITWNPNGTQIAIAGGNVGCHSAGDHSVRILDAATGQIIDSFSGHSCSQIDIAWSPDGSKIVTSALANSETFIWNAITGEFLIAGQFRTEIGVGVAWSPDSSQIASIGSGGKYAFIWDATSGEILFALPEHEDFTTSVVWKPDGTEIATSALDNTIRTWDVVTQQAILTLQSTSQVYWVDWSPDGTRLVSANSDGTIQIWDAVSGQALDVLTGHTGSVEIVHWSPDGTQIASGGLDGTIRIWDTTTGQLLEIIQSSVGPIVDLAWKPDGSQLAYIGTESGNQSQLVEIVDAPSIVFCNTTIPASDTTSLIAAITSANGAGTPQTLCLTDSTYTLTAVDNTTDGSNGLPSIVGDITIVGDGATIILESGSGFAVAGEGRLTLLHLIVASDNGE